MIHSEYIYILFIILIIILFHSKNIDLSIKETYEDSNTCDSCTRKRRRRNDCHSCDDTHNSIENFNQVNLKTNRVTFNLTPQTFYY